MDLKPLLILKKLVVEIWHQFFKRFELLALFILRIFIHRSRRPCTGNNVLTLSVYEVFTVELILAITRISREGHTRAAIVSHVAKHHGLNVHRRTPFIRYILDRTIFDRSFAGPAAEYGTDRAPHLLRWILGKLGSQYLLNRFLKVLDKCF